MRCLMVPMSTLNRCGDRSMSRKISLARWRVRASASASAAVSAADASAADNAAAGDDRVAETVCDDDGGWEDGCDDAEVGEDGMRWMNILLLSQLIAFSTFCRVSRTKVTAWCESYQSLVRKINNHSVTVIRIIFSKERETRVGLGLREGWLGLREGWVRFEGGLVHLLWCEDIPQSIRG